MCERNINDASDKLNLVDDKIEFIVHVLMNLNMEFYSLNENDLTGLGLILTDLQKEVKEVKKLLD